jgi:hypothetical protein
VGEERGFGKGGAVVIEAAEEKAEEIFDEFVAE